VVDCTETSERWNFSEPARPWCILLWEADSDSARQWRLRLKIAAALIGPIVLSETVLSQINPILTHPIYLKYIFISFR
jgi:hypothetical protein